MVEEELVYTGLIEMHEMNATGWALRGDAEGSTPFYIK